MKDGKRESDICKEQEGTVRILIRDGRGKSNIRKKRALGYQKEGEKGESDIWANFMTNFANKLN